MYGDGLINHFLYPIIIAPEEENIEGDNTVHKKKMSGSILYVCMQLRLYCGLLMPAFKNTTCTYDNSEMLLLTSLYILIYQ